MNSFTFAGTCWFEEPRFKGAVMEGCCCVGFEFVRWFGPFWVVTWFVTFEIVVFVVVVVVVEILDKGVCGLGTGSCFVGVLKTCWGCVLAKFSINWFVILVVDFWLVFVVLVVVVVLVETILVACCGTLGVVVCGKELVDVLLTGTCKFDAVTTTDAVVFEFVITVGIGAFIIDCCKIGIGFICCAVVKFIPANWPAYSLKKIVLIFKYRKKFF